MSALTKPHSKFTAAVNSDTLVPNEHVLSAEPKNVPALGNNKANYSIVFTVVYPNSATKEIEINFADDDAARDTSLGNWLTANCVNVA